MSPARFVRFFALLLAVAGFVHAQEPFDTNFPPTLTFRETYDDRLIEDPDYEGEYITAATSLLTVSGKVSLRGVDLTSLDADTPFAIELDELSLSVTLGGETGDVGYRVGEQAAVIPVLNSDGESVGSIRLNWNAQELTYNITIRNDPGTTGNYVRAPDLAAAGEEFEAYEEIGAVTLSFADRELSGRALHIGNLDRAGRGSFVSLTTVEDPNGNSFDLMHVRLEGEIDSTPPGPLTVTRPASGRTSDKAYVIRGTARDDYGIAEIWVTVNGEEEQTAEYDGEGEWTLSGVALAVGVNTITVRAVDADGNEASAPAANITLFTEGPQNVALTSPPESGRNDGITTNTIPFTIAGTATDDYGIREIVVSIDDGPAQPATYDGTLHWALPGVLLPPGKHKVTATVIDSDGNAVSRTGYVTYAKLSPLTIRAAGTAPGQVRAQFSNLAPPFQTIDFTPGPVQERLVPDRIEGARYVVTAVPGPAAFFNGWMASDGQLLANGSTSPRLEFTMTPDLVLTAEFIANPFIAAKGTYQGLIQSADPRTRGLFVAKLNPNGSFTGSAKFTTAAGLLTLPLKGRFDNVGEFSGSGQSGGAYYPITLRFEAAGGGRITGAIPGFDATFSAELPGFTKRGRGLPAEEIGSYNVVLPPAASTSDPAFPAGVSWGRVTVSRLGAARFTGRLSNGGAVAAGASLSSARRWPFFAALNQGTGSLAGLVTLDRSEPDSDFGGLLDWYHPASPAAAVHPEEFRGAVEVIGVKYAKPAKGVRVFLTTAEPAGSGTVSFDAPQVATVAAVESLLGEQWEIALGTDNKAVLTPSGSPALGGKSITAAKLKLAPATGTFTGSFVEAEKTIRFSGIVLHSGATSALVKRDFAAGWFLRGGRSGAIRIEP